MKTLSYSYVKYSPRVPWLLLTVEKIEHENFDFVLLSFFLLSSLPSSITQKVYEVYEWSTHQMNALLSEIFLFLVRPACQLRLLWPKTCVVVAFLYAILCVIRGGSIGGVRWVPTNPPFCWFIRLTGPLLLPAVTAECLTLSTDVPVHAMKLFF